MKFVNLIAIALLVAAMTGCETAGQRPGEEPEAAAPIEERPVEGDRGAAARGAEGQAAPGRAIEGQQAPRVQAEETPTAEQPSADGAPLLAKRVVYFDYDSNQPKAEDQEVITAHARYLASNPNARVTVEGHADERGSREYNIALGERRANAVQQMLVLQGASRDQIETVSYGEERPASADHDEAAWALNRRVELVYGRR